MMVKRQRLIQQIQQLLQIDFTQSVGNTMSKTTDTVDQTRRSFLSKGSATVAASVVAPGVFLQQTAQAKPADQPVSDKVRWGMLVDTSKCADGCNDCAQACDKENGLDMLKPPSEDTAENWELQRPHWLRTVSLKDNLTNVVTHLPMMCQHCENPPCQDVCPTGASFRRADGIVMVDRHTCIGCRYCMMACPYKARSFIHEDIPVKPTETPRGKGCVESCNFCVQRIDAGNLTTACQEACSHNAIVFGDLNDPASDVAKAMKSVQSRAIREDLQLNPSVRYTGI